MHCLTSVSGSRLDNLFLMPLCDELTARQRGSQANSVLIRSSRGNGIRTLLAAPAINRPSFLQVHRREVALKRNPAVEYR
jgi:hypothetical protein